MENEQIIRKFYEAFARSDAEAMISYYHEDIKFSDPAFQNLSGDEAKNMWRMLIERGRGNIKIEFSDVTANDKTGSANWIADYPFSKTGRNVHNEIHAEFEFKDGKIIRHTDTFNLWKWSKQALGLPGMLLGWSSLLQNKIRQNALDSLREYSEKLRK